jgi:hypothetical protein
VSQRLTEYKHPPHLLRHTCESTLKGLKRIRKSKYSLGSENLPRIDKIIQHLEETLREVDEINELEKEQRSQWI